MITWVYNVQICLFCSENEGFLMKEKTVKKNKKNAKNNQADSLVKGRILSLVFIFTPVIISLFIMVIKWLVQGYVALPGPKWNDEAVYLKLIQSYSDYFSPRGYWGFDAKHAILGNGPAWSPAILLPYVIPAIVFPVGYSFVYICNIVYITIVNALFLLLTKPDLKRKIKLAVLEATSVVFVLYINTNMSELFRFALAILIAGLLYKMFFDECPKWISYIVAPLVILYSIQVYTFFAFCIPIYVFALLSKKKTWLKIVVSLLSTGIVSGASYYLLHLISSNYNIGKTEALLHNFSGGHVFLAIKSFLSMVIDGARGLLALRYSFATNGIYLFHVMIIVFIVFASVISLLDSKASKKDKATAWICIYSICVFVFMYMTLYTIIPDTFMRGTEIAVLFSLVLLVMTEDKYLSIAILFCNAMGLFFLPANLKYFQSEGRYMTAEDKAEWRSMEEDLKNVITIKESDNPWDNTVIMYSMEPKVIMAIPSGMGENYILNNGYYGNESEYMFFTIVSHLNDEWIEQDYSAVMIENGDLINALYEPVYDRNGYICYKKIDSGN